MLSNTAVRSASLQRPPGGVLAYSHIPGNNLGGCHDAGGGSDCANVLAANPQMRVALYRKYFGVQKSGSGRMAQPKRRKRKRLSMG